MTSVETRRLKVKEVDLTYQAPPDDLPPWRLELVAWDEAGRLLRLRCFVVHVSEEVKDERDTIPGPACGRASVVVRE